MKLKSLALAAALVASSASSFAAGGSLGLISDNASFSSTVAAGAFADVWTFDTSVVDANASITNIRTKKFSNYITSFEAWLDGNMLTSTTLSYTTTLSIEDLPLAAGSHTLEIKGFASAGGASYGGNIGVTAVPEPETYAMLLAGLGLMGAIARRRNNKAA